MGESERDELRQYVADLAERTATMRHRESLPRESPEWTEAVEAEERLIARIESWARKQHVPPANEGDTG
jgi:hypothetical protein